MIGDIISELRKDRNMTQRDLARVLNTSVATISHYETETNAPDIVSLIKLADFFGVSVDYLLGRTRLRMDFNMFSRDVRMIDGTVTSAEKVLTQFLQLSDKSQTEVLNLISLFQLRDSVKHNSIISPFKGNTPSKGKKAKADKTKVSPAE